MIVISAGFVVEFVLYGRVGAAETVIAHSAETIQYDENILSLYFVYDVEREETQQSTRLNRH